ncbi:MAG: membrane protein insertase YidC [Oscillospiraceae bacterium]
MLEILGYPLGWIMYGLYSIVNNYALTLLLFTVFTRLILVPLAIKQQKTSVKMAAFRPRIAEIQEKYKNNPQKMNEEMSQLYAEEKFNPMAGCLPMLIQMPILFGLIDVIYRPLSHILRPGKAVIDAAVPIAKNMFADPTIGAILGRTNPYSPEIDVIKAVNYAVQNGTGAFDALGSGFVNSVSNFQFSLFGVNLGDIPTLRPSEASSTYVFILLLMVPIVSGLTAALVNWITTKNNSVVADAQTKAMTTSMTIFMPIMSVYIAFKVPIAVGLYWILSNILMAIQSFVLYKFMNPQKMAEKATAEMEERRQKAREERAKAREIAKTTGNEDAKEKAMSQKEINRMKLAEARKRDAIKYGEEYNENELNDD